jgi:hypothetical protein
MPLPKLALEILLMIGDHMRDERGDLRYADFNSFLQVNSALHACLNRQLWKEASADDACTQRIFTRLIKTKNRAGLKFFLAFGANVEVGLPAFKITDPNEGTALVSEPTPLLVAADLDDIPLARLLLEKGGAKVQCRGKFSPLHAARSADMVQLLLDHNADPEILDNDDWTPLYWYITRVDITAMRAILQHGAEVDQPRFHWGILEHAVQSSLDAVQLLVEHGADVKHRDYSLNTPLHRAARTGKIDVVKFLVERWPEGMQATNRYGQTPLHRAAQEGKIDVVRFLVERWPEGMQATIRCFEDTPLHSAVRAGETDVMRFLVECWPEGIRATNRYRETPLHLAAKTGKIDVVRFLVERWPEGKKALNIYGETPLQASRL